MTGSCRYSQHLRIVRKDGGHDRKWREGWGGREERRFGVEGEVGWSMSIGDLIRLASCDR